MFSVRITAAGAVFVAGLTFLTAPARACDDRFIKKCEKASAAAFAAEETAAAPAAKRAPKRVKVVAARQSKHSQLVRRTHAPRFAVRTGRRTVLASGDERATVLPAQSLMARRFRGFIDPQPVAQNAFEALRKPHLLSLDFEASAIMPPIETAEANAAPAETAAAAPPPPAVTTTPKRDKLAKPARTEPATMELASAESRLVVLPAPPSPSVVAPVAAAPAAAPAPAVLAEAAPVQASLTETPPASPSRFSIHGLVLAFCGALGAASALRFIVGA